MVEVVCIGGLESVLEMAILGGGFVCMMLLLNVVGILVSVVFCAGVHGFVLSDGRSRVEGDGNVTCGRVLLQDH